MNDTEKQIIEDNYHLFALLSPKCQPLNRHVARQMAREYDRISELVYENVEKGFYDEVLNNPMYLYKESYRMALDLFKKCLTIIRDEIKPRYWYVNERYIEDLFKPTSDTIESESDIAYYSFLRHYGSQRAEC